MKKVNVKELTLDSFNMYGSFAKMINPQGPHLGSEPVEFYRDMAFLGLGQTSTAAFSITRVLKRPNIIDVIEHHKGTGEGIMPIDGDVLMHVALATPNGEYPVDKIEVFRVPKGTVVTLRPGVWHCAPFAEGCESVNILVVLPERIYANDCIVYEIPEEDRLEIVK